MDFPNTSPSVEVAGRAASSIPVRGDRTFSCRVGLVGSRVLVCFAEMSECAQALRVLGRESVARLTDRTDLLSR
jgi:hypothetical protein